MHRVLHVTPDVPSLVHPALPRSFDAVVAKALAKKPHERFANAHEFQLALVDAMQGKSVEATATSARTLPLSEAQGVEATRATRTVQKLELAPEVVAELERSLSRHIGPLAKVLVKRGQGEAASMDDFCQILADNIPTPVERAEFLAKVLALKKTAQARAPEAAPAATPPVNFTPEAVALAEKRLASYVGPLARVLVKNAVNESASLRELYSSLAAHIDDEDERREFLALIEH
jgi:serine/threonine-protein kinase